MIWILVLPGRISVKFCGLRLHFYRHFPVPEAILLVLVVVLSISMLPLAPRNLITAPVRK
jgi:hypothetical protein